ncbi:hypothetical protein FQA39_LY05371 [Lamprigera yunnana]|nr:hypothetical protein FQA39_LY05371 [Lamprigera yunnana]
MTQFEFYLLLWSGIMVRYFGFGAITSSSAAIESHFNHLKNRLFIEKLPLSADEFITNHVRILQDTMHLASGLTFLTDSRGNCDTTLNGSLLQEEKHQHVTAKILVSLEERTNDINKNEGIHAEENNKVITMTMNFAMVTSAEYVNMHLCYREAHRNLHEARQIQLHKKSTIGSEKKIALNRHNHPVADFIQGLRKTWENLFYKPEEVPTQRHEMSF